MKNISVCFCAERKFFSFFFSFPLRVAVDKRDARLELKYNSNWEMAPHGLGSFYFPALIEGKISDTLLRYAVFPSSCQTVWVTFIIICPLIK